MIRSTCSISLILYFYLLSPMGIFAAEKTSKPVWSPYSGSAIPLSPDSLSITAQTDLQKKQDKKSSKNSGKQKKEDVKVEIKQVPKAKRQMKPAAFKPTIKVKPIKIIRPKIKKP